ncbi:MAG: M6 family metalloprotease domain-containing protein, partial [Gammaproteobacteria bacterium]|nr:M6 family metalloprotease domain-containing protein [Gammaproteobacteria bacterium]
MTEYFDEISYGSFQLTGTVYDWVTVSQNRDYYEGDDNGYGTYPQSSKGFIREVVELNDATVDFGDYDNDGPDGVPNSGDDDGYADAVAIVYTGAGPDWHPGNDHIWPHMSNLNSNQEFTTNDDKSGGGKIIVKAYFICPEISGGGNGNGNVRPLGVFVHEFGHVLGLPDLYDRTDATEEPDFEDSNGIGEWCLMASGSWGGDGNHGDTPAHMSAWCKIQMGWLNPTVITSQTNSLSINQVETNAEAWLLWEDPYEGSSYFLIENRQKTGFDQYLNGDGLLIYHVDENQRWGPVAWSSGVVNDDETHKLVDLEEADGLANLDNSFNRGDTGDPFPGTTNNTSFTDNTIPNARSYKDQTSGVAITNISSSASSMTADILPHEILGYTLAYDEGGISGNRIGFSGFADSWGGVEFQAGANGKLKTIDI